jgi:hypothetical protein
MHKSDDNIKVDLKERNQAGRRILDLSDLSSGRGAVFVTMAVYLGFNKTQGFP